MSKFANKLTVLDEYISFLSEKHGVSMDETHDLTIQELFNDKSLFEQEEEEEIAAQPGTSGKGAAIDVEDSDIVSDKPAQDAPEGSPEAGKEDAEGEDSEAAKKAAAAAQVDGPEDLDQDPNAKKVAQDAAKKSEQGELEPDPKAQAMADQVETDFERSMRKNGLVGTMAKPVLGVVEKGLKFLFGSGVFDEPADARGLLQQVNQNPYLAPYYLSSQLALLNQALGQSTLGLKARQFADDIENTGDKINDKLPTGPDVDGGDGGGEGSGGGEGGGDDTLEAGESYEYTSRTGKKSAVQIIDPENEHGATVAQKINPTNCDPQKNTQFAAKPEKFVKSIGEPIEKCDTSEPGDKSDKEKTGTNRGEMGEADWNKLDIAKFNKQHPQVQAAGLALMPKNKAIEVFKKLLPEDLEDDNRAGPDADKANLIQRTAAIRSIPADVIKQVGERLGIELPEENVQINGPQRAVDILKSVGQEWEMWIFGDLQGRDGELAEYLRTLMFQFKDIIDLQAREVQLILREVDTQQLAIALQGASDELKKFIFSNVSSRVEQEITSWSERAGPQSKKEIQKQKAAIVEIILNLAEEGKVNTRPESVYGKSRPARGVTASKRSADQRRGKFESRLRNALHKLITESLKTEVSIINETSEDMSELVEMMNQFFPYSKDRLGFNRPVTAELKSDPANAADPLGKTAYYDPNKMHIVLFTDKRHPKDVLRSFSHELVHHSQNCRGEFDNGSVTEEGYAQNDKHLRKMEKEAYLQGQLILRDWEDSKKENRSKMNEKTIRNIARRVMESVKSEVRTRADGKLPTNDPHRGSHGRGRQELPEGDMSYKRNDEDTLEEAADCSKLKDEIEGLESAGHIGSPQHQKAVSDYEDCKKSSLEEGGAAARTGNEEKDQGRERMTTDRVHEGDMGHNCADVHPDEEHDVWEQKERIGPVAHTTVSENKSNYDLFLKKKDSMIFEKLMKKWCK